MAASRAPTTLQKLFPVDTLPVTIPVLAAGTLFTWFVGRTIISDPDGHSSARNGISGIDDQTAAARGEGWRGGVRNYFSARVSAGNTSIFPNKIN